MLQIGGFKTWLYRCCEDAEKQGLPRKLVIMALLDELVARIAQESYVGCKAEEIPKAP